MTYTNQQYAEMAHKANLEGKIIQIENGEIVLKDAPAVDIPYTALREMEYPSLGDMIDALCKDKSGDSTELNELIERRNAIKSKYPKTSS